MPELVIRLPEPGDEAVVRELATSDGPGDPETLLSDRRTLMLLAFEGEPAEGDDVAANALYRSVGGTPRKVVEWELAYTAG